MRAYSIICFFFLCWPSKSVSLTGLLCSLHQFSTNMCVRNIWSPFNFISYWFCTYIQQIYLVLSEFFFYVLCMYICIVSGNRSDAGMFLMLILRFVCYLLSAPSPPSPPSPPPCSVHPRHFLQYLCGGWSVLSI